MKQEVVMVKNFLAMADTGVMSLGDNQASFPARCRAKFSCFRKGKKGAFHEHEIRTRLDFSTMSKEEPTFLELEARLHPLGEYPKRKERDHLLDCCAAL